MRVLMRVPRVMQDAGRLCPLDAGRIYALPAVLAQEFIASGVAEAVAEEPEAYDAAMVEPAFYPRKRRRP